MLWVSATEIFPAVNGWDDVCARPWADQYQVAPLGAAAPSTSETVAESASGARQPSSSRQPSDDDASLELQVMSATPTVGRRRAHGAARTSPLHSARLVPWSLAALHQAQPIDRTATEGRATASP